MTKSKCECVRYMQVGQGVCVLECCLGSSVCLFIYDRAYLFGVLVSVYLCVIVRILVECVYLYVWVSMHG